MADEPDTDSAPTAEERRNAFLQGIALRLGVDRTAASAMLAGFIAGRAISVADITQTPNELADHIRDYALQESGNGKPLEPGTDAPAVDPTAAYSVEVGFRAPLSAALAVTTDIVQRALPKAWKTRVRVTSVRITTGAGGDLQTAAAAGEGE